MKTKKSTNYDQYFSLSKRMRFPVKLGNNMRSYLRILTVFRLHMVKILKRMGLSIVRVHLEPSYLYCSAKSKNRAVVKTCSFFKNFKNCLKFSVRVYSGYWADFLCNKYPKFAVESTTSVPFIPVKSSTKNFCWLEICLGNFSHLKQLPFVCCANWAWKLVAGFRCSNFWSRRKSEIATGFIFNTAII